MATALELAAGLMRAPPRAAKVLSERLLAARSRAEAAEYWAVPPSSADLMLLRAARSLEAALARQPEGRPPPFGLEASQAQGLAQSLEGTAATPDLAPLAALLGELVSQREAVAAQLRVLQELAEASPQRRFETWARRVAVVVVVGLTLFFYWREQHKEHPAPHYEPRPPARTH